MQEEPELLPRCDQCRMHIPSAKIYKHRQTDKRNKATERRLRWIYVEMAERIGEMRFNLEGEE